jgi:hypothetical protein
LGRIRGGRRRVSLLRLFLCDDHRGRSRALSVKAVQRSARSSTAEHSFASHV